MNGIKIAQKGEKPHGGPATVQPSLDSIVDVLMHGCVLNGRPPGGPPMARPSGMPVRSATESPAA